MEVGFFFSEFSLDKTINDIQFKTDNGLILTYNVFRYNSNHSCQLSMVLTGAAFYHRVSAAEICTWWDSGGHNRHLSLTNNLFWTFITATPTTNL